MTDRELMQQALDALVRMHSYGDVFRYQNWQANPYEQVSDSVTALRERLAQPEQEPVAWIGRLEGGIEYSPYHKAALKLPEGVRFDLYTSPQQRKPLTEEEITALVLEWWCPTMVTAKDRKFVRAIERAHGIGETT